MQLVEMLTEGAHRALDGFFFFLCPGEFCGSLIALFPFAFMFTFEVNVDSGYRFCPDLDQICACDRREGYTTVSHLPERASNSEFILGILEPLGLGVASV